MKTMVTALAGLVFVGLVIAVGYRVINPQASVKNMPHVVLASMNDPVDNLDDPDNLDNLDNLENLENLEKIVPEGKELTFDEFQKRAGKDVAQLLTPLKPTHIKRSGNRFTLTCAPTTISRQGVTVYVSSTVSCQASKAGNVITLKNISGVQVNVGVGGKLNLKEAVITPGANNSARIDGKLDVSRWLPYIPFSVTVDLDKIP